MKRKILFLIVVASIAKYSFGQNKHISETYLQMPEQLKKTNAKSDTYENRNEDGITSLQLKADNSFIYLSLSADGYKLSAGKYNLVDDIVTLVWDSISNYKAIEDTSLYKKFYARLKPTVFKIDNISYSLNEESGKLKKEAVNDTRSIELFFSPTDVYNKPFRIDAFKRNNFMYDKNKLIVKTKDDKQYVFRLDSVWAFRFILPSDGGYTHLWRNYKKDYRIPVYQIDGMVMYRIYNGSNNSSFFSKDAYSDVHLLTKKNLKKFLSDDPKFLELIEKNKDWDVVEHINGQYKWKVVELYKQSLQQ